MSKKWFSNGGSWASRALLLPVAVILWVFGWSLFWIGSRKAMTKHTKPEKEPVSVNIASEILQEHEIRV